MAEIKRVNGSLILDLHLSIVPLSGAVIRYIPPAPI